MKTTVNVIAIVLVTLVLLPVVALAAPVALTTLAGSMIRECIRQRGRR